MKINIDLRLVARLLGMFEWVWIVCLVILCIGQSIGTDMQVLDMTTLTWLMMLNTIAILWIAFRLTRESVERLAEKEETQEAEE